MTRRTAGPWPLVESGRPPPAHGVRNGTSKPRRCLHMSLRLVQCAEWQQLVVLVSSGLELSVKYSGTQSARGPIKHRLFTLCSSVFPPRSCLVQASNAASCISNSRCLNLGLEGTLTKYLLYASILQLMLGSAMQGNVSERSCCLQKRQFMISGCLLVSGARNLGFRGNELGKSQAPAKSEPRTSITR